MWANAWKKLKSYVPKNWVILMSFAVLLLPLFMILLVYILLRKNAFDNAEFWYGYMAYFGSVVLAAVAMHQAQKSNRLSQKIDEMNILQNYSLAKCTKRCAFQASYHDDCTITHSGQHERDSGAVILLERMKEIPEATFNEYLIELCFKDFSKAALKSLEIVTDQMVCVQKPDIDGICWDDDSDDVIPVGFSSTPFTQMAYPIWIDDNVFRVILKIYSPSNGFISNMLENSIPLCLIMRVKLHSVCGISTLMKYKYWFSKQHNVLSIDNCESILLEITQESE